MQLGWHGAPKRAGPLPSHARAPCASSDGLERVGGSWGRAKPGWCEVARLQEHVRGVVCAQARAGPCEGGGRCKGVGGVCSMVIG